MRVCVIAMMYCTLKIAVEGERQKISKETENQPKKKESEKLFSTKKAYSQNNTLTEQR